MVDVVITTMTDNERQAETEHVLNTKDRPGFGIGYITGRRFVADNRILINEWGKSLTADIYFICSTNDFREIYTAREIVEKYSITYDILEGLRIPAIKPKESTFMYDVYLLYDSQCTNLVIEFKRFAKYAKLLKQ